MADAVATGLGRIGGGEEVLDLLHAVLDHETTGVCIYLPLDGGKDFLHIYVNPAYQALKPFRPMEGRRYTEIWPELVEFATPRLKEVLETGETWTARDQPLEIEVSEGVRGARYYTYEIQRLQVGDKTYLLNTSRDVTREVETREELVRERAELRESEQRFRSVLENSLDAAYRRDLSTDAYDYLSPVIQSITGFGPEEFARLSIDEMLERIHPEDLPDVLDAIPEASETGRLTIEYRFKGKDGSYVWLADHAVIVKGSDGEPLYLSGVVRDVTHRKRLEEQAELEHRRLRTLLDTLPVGVFISDAQGGLLYTNEQVTEIWGELPETPSIDEYGLYKAWRPETGGRLRAEDWSGARALRGETVLGEVLEIERFDGEHSTILNSSVPIRDEQGTITGQVTVEQDITERVRAEQDLRASEERLRLALGAARMAAWEYDPVTLEVTLTENAEEVLELPRRHEDSDQGYSLIHPDDVERHRALVNEAIEAGRSYVSIYRHPRGEGEIWLEEHGRAVTDAEGKVVRLVGVVQNITERLRIETQLREALEAQREAARYSDALNEVDADVTSTLDVQRIMSLVVERTADAVGADMAVIYVPVEGGWEARHTWRAPPWLDGSLVSRQGIPFSTQAASEGRTLFFPEPAAHPDWEGSVAQRLGARQVLDAPLVLGTDEAGDLTVYKLDGTFTEADRDFLQKASTAVSLALQNARRYERERDVADTLQEALLTLPEAVPGLEFAHAYHSASELARVGGDFYDVFRISSDTIGVVVGDVAGKGLEASVLTSLTKNTIRAHATEKGAVPARVLELTNEVVLEETRGESFVTVFFGALNLVDGSLVYANGGHTTGVVVAADGRLVELPSTGPMVGAFLGIPFDEAELRVDIDASLFLYTDGLTEARRDDEFFGEERIFHLLADHSGERPAKTMRAVLDEVLRFTDGRLNDDLAVLVLKRLGSVEDAPRPERIEV